MTVGDVLHAGPHYPPRFLIQSISVPVRVDSPEIFSQSVVFPETICRNLNSFEIGMYLNISNSLPEPDSVET